jgi:hypothetical protein
MAYPPGISDEKKQEIDKCEHYFECIDLINKHIDYRRNHAIYPKLTEPHGDFKKLLEDARKIFNEFCPKTKSKLCHYFYIVRQELYDLDIISKDNYKLDIEIDTKLDDEETKILDKFNIINEQMGRMILRRKYVNDNINKLIAEMDPLKRYLKAIDGEIAKCRIAINSIIELSN